MIKERDKKKEGKFEDEKELNGAIKRNARKDKKSKAGDIKKNTQT